MIQFAENVTVPDVDELIRQFESDIVHNCHSYVARFERSKAQQELVRHGKDALPSIVEHLKANPPTDGMDLRTAWGHLLCLIQANIDSEKTSPVKLKDTEGWVAWAESMLT